MKVTYHRIVIKLLYQKLGKINSRYTYSELHLEPSRTSAMELLIAKIING